MLIGVIVPFLLVQGALTTSHHSGKPHKEPTVSRRAHDLQIPRNKGVAGPTDLVAEVTVYQNKNIF